MLFTIKCPACRRDFDIDEADLNWSVTCPLCSEKVVAPPRRPRQPINNKPEDTSRAHVHQSHDHSGDMPEPRRYRTGLLAILLIAPVMIGIPAVFMAKFKNEAPAVPDAVKEGRSSDTRTSEKQAPTPTTQAESTNRKTVEQDTADTRKSPKIGGHYPDPAAGPTGDPYDECKLCRQWINKNRRFWKVEKWTDRKEVEFARDSRTASIHLAAEVRIGNAIQRVRFVVRGGEVLGAFGVQGELPENDPQPENKPAENETPTHRKNTRRLADRIQVPPPAQDGVPNKGAEKEAAPSEGRVPNKDAEKPAVKDPEKLAAQKLEWAKLLLDEAKGYKGKSEKAVARLKAVVTEYPGTAAAKEAQSILDTR
jgi:hypothetical protein